jgi:MFS transporter, putative metabolite:H+ symporter
MAKQSGKGSASKRATSTTKRHQQPRTNSHIKHFTAYATPTIGWHGLFAVGVLPALACPTRARLGTRIAALAGAPRAHRGSAGVPRLGDADQSAVSSAADSRTAAGSQSQLVRFVPVSVQPAVSWLGNAGAQTGVYGIVLWAPSLFAVLLKVTPQEASKMMILLTVVGFVGRIAFSWLSERIGRRKSGGLLGLGAGALMILAGYHYDATVFGLSAFWLILAAAMFFAHGGFAIVGPYAAEVWPAHLRTSGMGSAYGFGGIGKILGPLGLALAPAIL